jgi:hypothetical protein
MVMISIEEPYFSPQKRRSQGDLPGEVRRKELSAAWRLDACDLATKKLLVDQCCSMLI